MQALQHLVVVDISGTIATCYSAKLFSDYGAQVFNLETEEGFPTRKIKPFIPDTNESAMPGYLNTNKKSVKTLKFEELKKADLVIYDQNIDQIDAMATQFFLSFGLPARSDGRPSASARPAASSCASSPSTRACAALCVWCVLPFLARNGLPE